MSDAQKRTPRPVPGRTDARSFPLSPTDGFVLSRIDGTLNEADLAASTGLPEAQVQSSIAKLETLGLIMFDGEKAAAELSSGHRQAAAPASAVVLRATPPPTPAPPQAAAAAEQVDLEPELRKRVTEAHREIDRRDYYSLLGVDEKADKKAVKRAYYELAAVFHPDRYFRKRLGPFKVQMEAIFARLTIAHETLSVAETRSEYDAYLSEQRRARAIEDHLAAAIPQAKQAEETIERSVRAREPATSSAPPAPTPSSIVPSHVDVNVAARRDTLARRLLGGHPPPTPSSAPPQVGAGEGARSTNPPSATGPGSVGAMSTADAMDALRRRYEDRVRLARAGEARNNPRSRPTRRSRRASSWPRRTPSESPPTSRRTISISSARPRRRA